MLARGAAGAAIRRRSTANGRRRVRRGIEGSDATAAVSSRRRPSGSRACRWGCARCRSTRTTALRELVAGQVRRRRRPAGRRRTARRRAGAARPRRPPGPSARSGRPTTTTSNTAGWLLQGLLDLLGEHLLAAGVDRDRVAPVELEPTRRPAPGPGRRRRRGARRRSPGRCAPSCPGRRGSRAGTRPVWASQPSSRIAGRRARAARSAESTTRWASARRCRSAAARRWSERVHPLAPGLRRAEHVDDPQVGDELEELAP